MSFDILNTKNSVNAKHEEAEIISWLINRVPVKLTLRKGFGSWETVLQSLLYLAYIPHRHLLNKDKRSGNSNTELLSIYSSQLSSHIPNMSTLLQSIQHTYIQGTHTHPTINANTQRQNYALDPHILYTRTNKLGRSHEHMHSHSRFNINLLIFFLMFIIYINLLFRNHETGLVVWVKGIDQLYCTCGAYPSHFSWCISL